MMSYDLQAWEWISEEEKKENRQIPSKQAENELNCQIWETKKKGIPI